MARLFTAYNKLVIQKQRLESLLTSAGSLSVQEQRLIAEIVLLRYFAVFEETVAACAYRLACKTAYEDGSRPNVIVPSKNIRQAETNMRTHGRIKPINYLKWTNSADIAKNLLYVLDTHEHFVRANGQNYIIAI